MPSPLKRYHHDLENKGLSPDPAQANAVDRMQRLYLKLLAKNKPGNMLSRLLDRFDRGPSRDPVAGLYFWGGVGRGKTYLIDCFFECLPFDNKLRVHFHRFMQRVHHELKQLQNIDNPLVPVANRIADRAQVLCLDEFHVADIADAMLLAGLLEALFVRKVVLVTTSNEEPDRLYWDGLQRQRFLPAIDLIKRHTQVVHIDSGVDYRLQYLDKAETYHTPLDEAGLHMLKTSFAHISPNQGVIGEQLEIAGRIIDTVCCGDGVVWFEFESLCTAPRGAADYIEIASCFQTVFLANLPIMDETQNDKAKRFMILVDEFYDRNVKLIMTAEAEPARLYGGRLLRRQFRRTISRLQEMGSHDYLARRHLP